MAIERAGGPIRPALPALQNTRPATRSTEKTVAPLESSTGEVVDEVVEIRLGLDPSSGRLQITGGDVRRQPRTAFSDQVDDSDTIGRLVDRVA